MKKYKTIILMCIFTTLGMIIGRYTSKNDVYEQDTIKRKNNNTISMMLETDTNSKTYIQSTDSTWPSDGYMFNENLSKCEQGSTLKWDEENKKLTIGYENCLECGACRIACEKKCLNWKYPDGNKGVTFKQG